MSSMKTQYTPLPGPFGVIYFSVYFIEIFLDVSGHSDMSGHMWTWKNKHGCELENVEVEKIAYIQIFLSRHIFIFMECRR